MGDNIYNLSIACPMWRGNYAITCLSNSERSRKTHPSRDLMGGRGSGRLRWTDDCDFMLPRYRLCAACIVVRTGSPGAKGLPFPDRTSVRAQARFPMMCGPTGLLHGPSARPKIVEEKPDLLGISLSLSADAGVTTTVVSRLHWSCIRLDISPALPAFHERLSYESTTRNLG
jgi:hypothetical protein